MPKEFNRTQRVGEQIKRALANLIQHTLKDPRLGMVTVSAVDVSRDLSHAKVFVTVLDDNADAVSSVDILNKAAGFIRHELGRSVVMRTTPQLHFVLDISTERSANISALIDAAVAEDNQTKR